MFRMIRSAVLITGVMMAGTQLYAQKEKPAVKVMARAMPDRILLRWGVTTPGAWKLTNGYGFEVTRYTVMRDGKMLPIVMKKVMQPVPFRPRPLDDWEAITQTDPYAAVIAQALYGKDFEVSGKADKSIASLVSQSSQLTQRYAMSLYAADNSFPAALMAGWGLEDTTVLPNEKYLYRVKALAPAVTMKIDSSGAYIGLKDYASLPVPLAPGAIGGNKSVLLSWDQEVLKTYYNAWIVEKSSDNGNVYTKINNLPVTNLNNKEQKGRNSTWLADSLADNMTVYLYRIRGISPFGETGPPSAPIKVKGKELLEYVPHIRSREIDEEGALTMTWEFDPKGNNKIKGFSLNQSTREEGPYQVVMEHLSADSRVLKYKQLYPTNYFTITAVAKEGESSLSFPVLVQPVDSVPPAPPVGLKAVIDSSGKVLLSWDTNKEPDILGYKIFRSHVEGQEMSPLVDTVFTATQFKDSVILKSLNSKVYYAVAAFDQRYNQSAFSAIITVKKPDVVPPSSPVLTDYKTTDAGVTLNWICSKDRDVAAHILYRRKMNDSSTKWTLLKVMGPVTDHYLDTDVNPGDAYSWLLLARDSSGLESPPMQPLRLTIPPRPDALKIKSFDAAVYREQRYIELFWKELPEPAKVQEYQLYKGWPEQPMSLWKVLPVGTKRITDEKLLINTNYQYGIRAVLKSGSSGQLTSINVQY